MEKFQRKLRALLREPFPEANLGLIENAVAKLAIRGLTRAAIAGAVGLSDRRARYYLARACWKVGVPNHRALAGLFVDRLEKELREG